MSRSEEQDGIDIVVQPFLLSLEKTTMHTDEYEISLAREINVCQRVVEETRKNLARRKARFAIDYPQAVQAAAAGSPAIDQAELAAWREDFEALPQWEQRLEQYRQALAVMRISASRF